MNASSRFIIPFDYEKGPGMSARATSIEREAKVRAVLLTASEPLGPTAIARAIGEDWCGGQPGAYPLSSTIVPVLRRISAQRVGTGQYTLPANAVGVPAVGSPDRARPGGAIEDIGCTSQQRLF